MEKPRGIKTSSDFQHRQHPSPSLRRPSAQKRKSVERSEAATIKGYLDCDRRAIVGEAAAWEENPSYVLPVVAWSVTFARGEAIWDS